MWIGGLKIFKNLLGEVIVISELKEGKGGDHMTFS
jgi:hypothetical protein